MPPAALWWLIEDKMPDRFAKRPQEMMEIRDMVKRSKAKEGAK